MLRKYKSLYSSTTNTFSTGESVTITPASVVGLPTDTEITLTFDRVDGSGTKTPDKMERIRGTIVGSNFVVSSGGRAVEGTEQVHTSPVVEMIWNADDWNDSVDWALAEHGQDGKHSSALVTTLKASGAVVNTGTSDDTIVTPKALADSDYAKTSDITVTADSTTTFTNKTMDYLSNTFTNFPVGTTNLSQQCIINGGFTVNQRVYVSNATLASGTYGHDRWKAGAGGGDYTFTQLAQATTITIKSGKSLIQVIEDKNVIGGTYTLSWTGTAQARFGIDSATPSGAYAASPITITTQTAGTVMSVEFNEGTLGQVNLANSSVALPFMPKSFEEELRACMRYFQSSYSYGITPGSADGYSQMSAFAFSQNTGTLNPNFMFQVKMRSNAVVLFYANDGATGSGTVARVRDSNNGGLKEVTGYVATDCGITGIFGTFAALRPHSFNYTATSEL
jgi:hypothetical protein